jgi:acetyl esterase/lipase
MISAMNPRVIVAALACLVLASCSGGPEVPAGEDPGSPGPEEYLPGLSATVDLVDGARAVVVVVPGGAWTQIWDPPGFRPLAEALVDAGYAVVQVTYRTAETGEHYPAPLQDVECAAAYAADQVPGVPVVLLGHSAGAHLSVLAGLRGESVEGCPYAAHPADAVVGLAGPYDVEQLGDLAENLFGVPEHQDRDLWHEGNPMSWVDERPELPFLLAHGTADSLPVSFTRSMAEALEGAGHPVALEVLDGREHNDMYQADVVADMIVDWLDRVLP